MYAKEAVTEVKIGDNCEVLNIQKHQFQYAIKARKKFDFNQITDEGCRRIQDGQPVGVREEEVGSSERKTVVEETETVVLGGGDVSKMRLYILGAIFAILLVFIAVWELPVMTGSPARVVESSKAAENSTFEVESQVHREL